jgi:hypothetical protein
MLSWLTIILMLIAGLIIFKIIKSVIKTVIIMSFIVLIVTGIFAFFIIKDMNDFKEEFPSAKKLFLLTDGEKLIAATSISEFDFGEDEMPQGFSDEELAALNADYDPDNLSGVIGDHYILFLYSQVFLEEGLPAEIPFSEDQVYSKREFIDAIFSDTPSDLLVAGFDDELTKATARAMILSDSSEEDLRALFMMVAFSHVSEERGVLYMIQQIKEEDLVIYPEYMVFGVVKKTPNFLLKMLIKE